MAIFYSPYLYQLTANGSIGTSPYTAVPSGTDFNYQDGDLFVLITAQAGTAYQVGVSGRKLGWTSYGASPKPYGTG